jgi:MFS family permease
MIAAFNAGAGILGFPVGGWLSDVAVRAGLGRKPLLIGFTSVQFVLTLIFGFVVAAGSANVWVMAALLFTASTFFNAMQPIAHAMVADIAAPEHHGAAFGMNNLIGEIGAVLSPAVSGALRDATGGWSRGWARRKVPADPTFRFYGVVVDRVNVSVLLYAPVRSASLAPIACLNPIATESLDTGPG